MLRPSPSTQATPSSRPFTARKRNSRPATVENTKWTGASRPTTARPMTSVSTKHQSSYVIALLEGRGVAREVGMAALDKNTGKVMLVQVSDCSSDYSTLRILEARGWPNIRKNPASNASPLPGVSASARYVPFDCRRKPPRLR